ncbi:MAG: DUF3343 domain-containing protein [Clostridia bacterium]|nr:DUF3343 domain-containing protein [Clostridia bacterium]
MEIVYTFPSTHAVIAAEQNVLSAKIKAKVRPIPTVIRAGCGLMLCISLDDKAQADKILADKNIPVDGVYSVQDGQYIPYV